MPEARPEGIYGPGGVVPGPVEAPVDEILNAPAQGTEQGRNRQRCAGHHQVVARPKASKDGSEREHEGCIYEDQASGHRAVDQRAVDDAVDLIQAVPQDSDTDSDRDY